MVRQSPDRARWLRHAAERGGHRARTTTHVAADAAPAAVWATVASDHGISSEQLAAAVAAAYRMPVAALDAADTRTLRLVPEALARRYMLFPLRESDREIVVATADPTDLDAEQALGFAAGRTPRFEVAAPAAIAAAIDSRYSPNRVVESLLANVQGRAADHVALVPADAASVAVGELEIDAEPVVQLTNVILRGAVTEGASDIHLEPTAAGGIVRFRVDGALREFMPLPMAALLRVVTRIKVLAALDIADRLRPQDGRARIRIADRLYDLRVSTVPARDAEKAVVRVLDPKGFRSLDDLDLPAPELARVRALLRGRSGLFLVTGPTGSGKTTTLYAALRELVGPAINVTTVEDPVEYELPGITQIQVETKRGVTFPSALRSILRQDPDVILIGEIRDPETAHIAVQAALTGHLVLASLHANDAIGAIARLHDLGVDRTLLADTVRGAIAQRLVRRVCAACGVRLDHDPSSADSVAVPVGCARCVNTGFRGRAVVLEVATMTPGLAELVVKGEPHRVMAAFAQSEGMRTMRETGMDRVRAGTTTVGELKRILGEPDVAVPPRPADQPCVLVADDDAVGRTLARGVLERAGCRVLEAPDGAEAMQRLAGGDHVDLVVLDLEMPRLDGSEVLRRLRSDVRTAGLPVVVLTGSESEGTEARLLEGGADDYVRKPLDPARFTARVRAALRRVGT
jgi:type II secretory ATPase GspE/PulE/Tfp pilus assembly ATPase PilB-like protein/CheY-like chemotaxis protein